MGSDSLTTYRKQKIEHLIDKYPIKMCPMNDYRCRKYPVDKNGHLRCGTQWCKDKLKNDFKSMKYKITRKRRG
jgi:hypothetical protein